MTSPSSQMAVTRTGKFPLGFRRGWSDWQKDLSNVLEWAQAHRFGVVDLGNDAQVSAPQAVEKGLRIGSVDLLDWTKLISPDKAVRAEGIQTNTAYIEALAKHGPMNYFLVMLPEKQDLPRSENFGYMVESFRQLTKVLEANKARIVIEGWPGNGALCCTPEGYQAFFDACPSPAMGVNFDPSHLIRMGIDPIRFLRQFGKRIFHVHGKDTELSEEGLYQYGNFQEPTFAQPRPFGGMAWRYTIPGHGSARWVEMFELLAEAGYQGAVSIELEDANFNGTPEGEKQGLLHSRDFLEGC